LILEWALNNEVKCKKGLCVKSYILKAIELQKIFYNIKEVYLLFFIVDLVPKIGFYGWCG
jgi:hypothetical protein